MQKEILTVALDGALVGLDADTGIELWKNTMPLGGHAWVALGMLGDLVFASASAKKLFCIDKHTGQTNWVVATSGMGRATILVSEDRVIIYKGSFVDAFSFNGSHLWSTHLKKVGKGAAALALNDIVVQADG